MPGKANSGCEVVGIQLCLPPRIPIYAGKTKCSVQIQPWRIHCRRHIIVEVCELVVPLRAGRLQFVAKPKVEREIATNLPIVL